MKFPALPEWRKRRIVEAPHTDIRPVRHIKKATFQITVTAAQRKGFSRAAFFVGGRLDTGVSGCLFSQEPSCSGSDAGGRRSFHSVRSIRAALVVAEQQGRSVIATYVLDDNDRVRALLVDLFSDAEGLVVVGSSGSAEAALSEVVRLRPRVAITDGRMPDGASRGGPRRRCRGSTRSAKPR
jgi:hypothetical protein